MRDILTITKSNYKKLVALILFFALSVTTFPTCRVDAVSPFGVEYRVHAQTYGWMDYVSDGATGGTTGQTKRMEAIQIRLGSSIGKTGSVEYRVHMQTYGWGDWVKDGQVAGTVGEAKRVEAIQIRLSNSLSSIYDVYYRVHMRGIGWGTWARNGETAGTVGEARQIEAIQIKVESKSNRTRIVYYMENMATIPWTTTQKLSYSEDATKFWIPNQKYAGIPYSQDSRRNNLEKFQSYLGSGNVYSKETTYGSDCSSSVSYAWMSVGLPFSVASTYGFLPGSSNIKKVGVYNYESNTAVTTSESVNTKSTMGNAYAQLKPADAVVRRYNGSGHIRLVTKVVISKTSTGAIDMDNSYILYIDQSEYGASIINDCLSSWHVDAKVSFTQLYNSHYIPVTHTSL